MCTNRSTRRLWTALSVLLGLLLVACGCQRPDVDRTAEWIEKAERILGETAAGYFTSVVYSTEWDLENAQTQLADERFPVWAHDRYEACIYWQTTFWTEVYNPDRRPGNSSVFIPRHGEGWGWILVGDRDVYILEFGYKFIDGESEPVIKIDAWDYPGGESSQ